MITGFSMVTLLLDADDVVLLAPSAGGLLVTQRPTRYHDKACNTHHVRVTHVHVHFTLAEVGRCVYYITLGAESKLGAC